MPIFDLFSKKQKALRGEVPDVYTYDAVPQELRVQIVHIWHDALGNNSHGRYSGSSEQGYGFIAEALCREYGRFNLLENPKRGATYQSALIEYFLKEEDLEKVLDVIQLSFQAIDKGTRSYDYLNRQSANEIADEAIADLNLRFRERGVGYEFTGGELVRIDSELLHAEVVKPALRLLDDKLYHGAQDEFLKAHKYYREGDEKEALELPRFCGQLRATMS